MLFLTLLFSLSNAVEAQIRVAGIGDNSGRAAAAEVFASGDLEGTFTEVSGASYNAMTIEELRSLYDVLIFTWISSPTIDADWETRIRPYLDLGGGVIFEDPANVVDLAPAITGEQYETGGFDITLLPVASLTDGISNEFENNHMRFSDWSPDFQPLMRQGGETIGLVGELPGAGRMIITGPDQHFHGRRGALGDEGNQYDLLVNELRWVSSDSFGPLDVTVSTSLLELNDEGWPMPNPVLVEAKVINPFDFRLDTFVTLHLSSQGEARFYIEPFEDSFPPWDRDPDEGFSFGEYIERVRIFVSPGEEISIQRLLWIQPSMASLLQIDGELGDAFGLIGRDSTSVSVPTAQIHPLVFVHGILGSMPPQNTLVKSQEQMLDVLDPFMGSYWPLLNNLQKMGYEWNKTLFAQAYDWRRSNADSAAVLASSLSGTIVPGSRLDYVDPDAKVDLVVHSMGGLVSRSYLQGSGYQGDVNKVVFIASPHQGFPFDYKTYEGMTWEDYLYNAPLSFLNIDIPFIPSNQGIGFLFDKYLWPILIEKHFRPTSADLLADCFFIPRGTFPAFPPPRQVWIPALVNGRIGVYVCDKNSLTTWVKHPTRGVLSLREMLPTEAFGDYLFQKCSQNRRTQPVQPNPFLESLNANIGVMVDRLGAGNIFAIYGTGAPETDFAYDVRPAPRNSSMWGFGRVTSICEDSDGDDLIPAESASLIRSGLLSAVLPPYNEAALDASPEGRDGGARHKEIRKDATAAHGTRKSSSTRSPRPSSCLGGSPAMRCSPSRRTIVPKRPWSRSTTSGPSSALVRSI